MNVSSDVTSTPRRSRLGLHVALGIVVVGALLLLVGLLAGVVFYRHFTPDIEVTLQNAGDAPMRSVVLHVTGGQFLLGDVASGATAKAKVRSKGESSL